MMSLLAGLFCYVAFDALRAGFRMESLEELTTGEHLSVLQMPADVYQSNVREGEIWFGGELYDVSHVTFANGMAFVTVFHDTGEEAVVKTESKFLDKDFQTAPQHSSRLAAHHFDAPNDGKILVAPFSLNITNYSLETASHFYIGFQKYPGVTASVLKPPPDSCGC